MSLLIVWCLHICFRALLLMVVDNLKLDCNLFRAASLLIITGLTEVVSSSCLPSGTMCMHNMTSNMYFCDS